MVVNWLKLMVDFPNIHSNFWIKQNFLNQQTLLKPNHEAAKYK